MEIAPSSHPARLQWSGSDALYLDTVDITHCGPVVLGRYGGSTAAGAHKNEDAALIWAAPDGAWTFAALLDAHGSSESANLVLARIAELEGDIFRLLDSERFGEFDIPPFAELSSRIVRHLSAADFRRACAEVRGETALLLCAQKGRYLWWFAIGDIPVYVFHPEFARLGQFALNQRMFFEWVGQVNTFALPVPCYATGVRQLRTGHNRVLMTTDGLLECGDRRFENLTALAHVFGPTSTSAKTLADVTQAALAHVHATHGRDSATTIAWDVEVPESGETMQPSA